MCSETGGFLSWTPKKVTPDEMRNIKTLYQKVFKSRGEGAEIKRRTILKKKG